MQKGLMESLSSFQLARLIPTVADSKKEERATSALLACFMAVPEFAKEVLSEAGAPTYKKMNIDAFTEVAFKGGVGKSKPRPDGLLILTSGNKSWTALVESKVGTKLIEQEQVEEYLGIAKQHSIDAVITISNQFATTAEHHPLKISKQKTRGIKLAHFSWLSILSKAILITDNKTIDDVEQAYILSELIRYFRHESSGVSSMTQMESGWKVVYEQIQHKSPVNKNSDEVQSSVRSWLQLSKHLSLKLSMMIGQPVSIVIPRKQMADPLLNHDAHCEQLAKECCLDTELDIPDAASKLRVFADFSLRNIDISMKLDAPKDKSRAPAAINWATRQLKDKKGIDDLLVRVYWPRRIPTTADRLLKVIEDPTVVIPDGTKEIPTAIEIVRVVDMMAKFKGSKVFVDECGVQIPKFYKEVGQNLSKWVAKAPKVKAVKERDVDMPTVLNGADEKRDEGENLADSYGAGSVNAPSFIKRLIRI